MWNQSRIPRRARIWPARSIEFVKTTRLLLLREIAIKPLSCFRWRNMSRFRKPRICSVRPQTRSGCWNQLSRSKAVKAFGRNWSCRRGCRLLRRVVGGISLLAGNWSRHAKAHQPAYQRHDARSVSRHGEAWATETRTARLLVAPHHFRTSNHLQKGR